jgi:hypothetical protein
VSTCTYLIPVSLFNMSHINVGIWFRLFRPLSLSRALPPLWGSHTRERERCTHHTAARTLSGVILGNRPLKATNRKTQSVNGVIPGSLSKKLHFQNRGCSKVARSRGARVCVRIIGLPVQICLILMIAYLFVGFCLSLPLCLLRQRTLRWGPFHKNLPL